MDEISRVLDPSVQLITEHARSILGRLEYFPGSRTLVVLDDIDTDPCVLTVLATEAPELYAELAPDEVLLANWTDRRGVPESLAALGFVQLTGRSVKVGMFGLEALVARLL